MYLTSHRSHFAFFVYWNRKNHWDNDGIPPNCKSSIKQSLVLHICLTSHSLLYLPSAANSKVRVIDIFQGKWVQCGYREWGNWPPKGLRPSIASFFSWQLEQRKGPSHGRELLVFEEPACMETPCPGFISTWQTAHMNNLNMLQTGYFASNLQLWEESKYNTRSETLQYLKWDTLSMRQNLSESDADPSSNSSSTTSGSQKSFWILEDDSEVFLRNIDLNTPFPDLLGGGGGGGFDFSGSCISTTIQVVSSRIPFGCTASCKLEEELRVDRSKINQVNNIIINQ